VRPVPAAKTSGEGLAAPGRTMAPQRQPSLQA
jgi:hypothetical protein